MLPVFRTFKITIYLQHLNSKRFVFHFTSIYRYKLKHRLWSRTYIKVRNTTNTFILIYIYIDWLKICFPWIRWPNEINSFVFLFFLFCFVLTSEDGMKIKEIIFNVSILGYTWKQNVKCLCTSIISNNYNLSKNTLKFEIKQVIFFFFFIYGIYIIHLDYFSTPISNNMSVLNNKMTKMKLIYFFFLN